MQSQVSVVQDEQTEWVFALDAAMPMTNAEGRDWLDGQFVQLGSEPLRPTGKLLLADKVLVVARDLAAQIAGGSRSIFGTMIESHIHAGAQKFTPGKDQVSALEYGKSITDACLGWEGTEEALEVLANAVSARRAR